MVRDPPRLIPTQKLRKILSKKVVDWSNRIHTNVEDIDIDKVASKAVLSSNQSMAGDYTYRKVNVDSSPLDEYDAFNSDNNSLVVQRDGVYSVDAHSVIDNLGQNNVADIRIRKNDSETILREIDHGSTSKDISTDGWTVVRLQEGDELTLELRQDSGNTKTILSGREDTFLSMVRLG